MTGSRRVLCTLALAVILNLLPPAHAGAEHLVRLAGNHPGAAAELAAEGDAPPAQRLRMQAYLAPRRRAKLARLLDEQQDPRSSRYHRWLSAAEYERRFGPTRGDVDAIVRWLVRSGFTVTFASAAQGRVAFEGDVATARSSFAIRIAGSRDGDWFGNLEDPMVPASLAPKIAYLAGLHNLSATTMQAMMPGSQLGIHFGPPDVWTYHDERQLLAAGMDGTGQCIAALEGSDVDQPSLAAFNTAFALPPFVVGQNYDAVFPDGPPGIEPPIDHGTAQAYAEALVDVEYAHGIAPGAEIVLYAGDVAGRGAQGLVDGAKAAT